VTFGDFKMKKRRGISFMRRRSRENSFGYLSVLID